MEAGLAVDQIVGGVEDLIVATVPFLFAGEAEKVGFGGWGWGFGRLGGVCWAYYGGAFIPIP